MGNINIFLKINKNKFEEKTTFGGSIWIRTCDLQCQQGNLLTEIYSKTLEKCALRAIFLQNGALVPIGSNRMKLIA